MRRPLANRRPGLLILLVAAILHGALVIRAATLETPTVDEYAHLPSGLAYWRHGRFELYAKNPPLIKLWTALPLVLGAAGPLLVSRPDVSPFGWGPWLYGMQFEAENHGVYLNAFRLARLMVLVLSLSTAGLLFLWVREDGDEFAAGCSAAAFLLCQTVLAHAHLATVDVGATFAIFLFAYFVRHRPLAWRRVVGAGLAFGIALAAKFTALFLAPLIVFLDRGRNRWLKAGAVAGIAVLALQASYFFTSPFLSIAEFSPVSTLFKSVARALPPSLAVPIPAEFLRGLDAQIGDAERGEFGNYLFGEWSRLGWWYYNLAALGLKEHPAWLLALLALPVGLWRRRKMAEFLWPAILLGIPLVFLNPLQVGVRYLLPVFPFLCAAVGRALKARAVFLAMVAVMAVSAVRVSPEHLSYFNFVSAWLGPKEDQLLDSNLDWGQDLYRLPDLVRRHGVAGQPAYLLYFGHVSPSLYGVDFRLAPDRPVGGLVVVSANFLKGMGYVTRGPDGSMVAVAPDHLTWLRSRTPIERAGSLLVYRVEEELPASAPPPEAHQ